MRDFGVKGVPMVVLVDKEGGVEFEGSPGLIDLDQRIN